MATGANRGSHSVKVLVLTGPESSGKSWLAAEIQAEFGGLIVGEYVRHFIEQNPRTTCYADIPAIAQGQLAWEDAARAQRPHLLILDTHLLSNQLWSQTLFSDCPAWLDEQLLARHYDLHLLLSPADVPWVDDGQRCQPQLSQRQAFQQHCRDWLELHQQDYLELHGDWQLRRAQALSLIAKWLPSR
jgi:NadR type nicotinamide-nucleotide adenylyltransferase